MDAFALEKSVYIELIQKKVTDKLSFHPPQPPLPPKVEQKHTPNEGWHK
jgi:hypothetical protein